MTVSETLPADLTLAHSREDTLRWKLKVVKASGTGQKEGGRTFQARDGLPGMFRTAKNVLEWSRMF